MEIQEHQNQNALLGTQIQLLQLEKEHIVDAKNKTIADTTNELNSLHDKFQDLRKKNNFFRRTSNHRFFERSRRYETRNVLYFGS